MKAEKNPFTMAKKLCMMQVRENGISGKSFAGLCAKEKSMLEKKGGGYFLKRSERGRIRVGLAGGVFDIIHIGHVFTLNEAKKHCDVLVAAVASDEHILKKGRKPVHSQAYRVAMVDFLKPVDVAIAGGKSYEETLARVGPDVIIYGYDQEPFLKPAGVRIVKLKKYLEPEKFKSSRIIMELGL